MPSEEFTPEQEARIRAITLPVPIQAAEGWDQMSPPPSDQAPYRVAFSPFQEARIRELIRDELATATRQLGEKSDRPQTKAGSDNSGSATEESLPAPLPH